MVDIYTLLSKYFDGEASLEEEKLIQQFKADNPEEFSTLQSFWKKKELKVKEFDTYKAWNKITKKTPAPKRVLLYPYLKYAASVAAVVLLLIGGLYLFNEQQLKSSIVNLSTQDQQQEITLEDGSIVYLNTNATLSYPEKFSSTDRIVTLTGEAFFDVAKDATRPFIINTNHSEVKVLGTSFNINTVSDHTEITVATGRVEVNSLVSKESSVLLPEQTALVSNSSFEVIPTENTNYLAWKTGVFEFNKTPIQQVVEDLNSYYENKIILSKLDTDCLFTSTFDQRELQEIIEIIQLSCHLQLQQKNTNYELY